jgi:hypothetical protein
MAHAILCNSFGAVDRLRLNAGGRYVSLQIVNRPVHQESKRARRYREAFGSVQEICRSIGQ